MGKRFSICVLLACGAFSILGSKAIAESCSECTVPEPGDPGLTFTPHANKPECWDNKTGEHCDGALLGHTTRVTEAGTPEAVTAVANNACDAPGPTIDPVNYDWSQKVGYKFSITVGAEYNFGPPGVGWTVSGEFMWERDVSETIRIHGPINTAPCTRKTMELLKTEDTIEIKQKIGVTKHVEWDRGWFGLGCTVPDDVPAGTATVTKDCGETTETTTATRTSYEGKWRNPDPCPTVTPKCCPAPATS